MIKKLSPLIFIGFITCLIFIKIFTKGYYPVPGDLLVSFYFPYYSGSWEGYNPWTTHKEMLGADSIRQIYLWKEFGANQFKKGKIPLWNPYTFSGQPLAANFQSSVFYPLNIFYFLTNAKNAWILLVVIQPLLGGIFMYFASRSFKLSKIPSLFSATAFMFSSYLITWMENGNISHSYIWLPLAIYSINSFYEKFKGRFLIMLIFSLALSILGGHPQTSIYIYITIVSYWFYKLIIHKKNLLIFSLIIGVAVFTSLLISAIQLIPTLEFYKVSPISLPFSREVFDRSILPYKNLITFFASDFFGHPANNNFWSQTYGDFTPYFGVVPLIFALWGIFKLRNQIFIKFAVLISSLFILGAVHGPITILIRVLKIPLLNATTPSRFISISIFFLIIISAFGLEDFINNFNTKKYLHTFLKFLAFLSLIYVLMWLFAIFSVSLFSDKNTWQMNLAVTRRNLILPTGMFIALLGLSTIIYLNKFKVRFLRQLLIISIFALTILGGFYFSNKFLPFAPKSFIFPDHPLFYWLQHNAGLNRFYGGGVAHIDFNFPTHYQIYGSEGYDTLRIERYAQLLASASTGVVPKTYLRSDGVFPTEENGKRVRLFELLGVKYLLDKEDFPKTESDWHYERFPNDQVEGYWQYGKFQVYQRKNVLPRIFLTNNYEVVNKDEEIINKIYDKKYDLKTIILEKEPPINIPLLESKELIEPQVIKYEPGEIIIKTQNDTNSLLFISDVYDKDWRVFVDNNRGEILRADYALESVAIPRGEHIVTLKYQPKSFLFGLTISLTTLTLLILLSLSTYFKRRF